MSALAVVCVLVGGGLGSCLRWALGLACGALFPAFNFGVVVVNTLGCFTAGLALAWFETRAGMPSEIRVLLFPGFLGGFTTFSAFSLETMSLFQSHPLYAGVYVLGTVAVCIAVTFFGYWLMLRLGAA